MKQAVHIDRPHHGKPAAGALWAPLPLDEVVARKEDFGFKVAVVLPTLNEAETIGFILDTWLPLRDEHELIDELLVVDSGSTDGTQAEVEARGVACVDAAKRMPELGIDSTKGKGANIWVSMFETTADILLFADSDMENPRTETITNLLTPLVSDPEVMLVKSVFVRDTTVGTKGGSGGGRVTRLTVNPLLQLLFPELTGVMQPLNGNIAIRRGALERMSFGAGYQVDLQILLQAAARFGADRIAQVHCGSFQQQGQSLEALERVAHQLVQTITDYGVREGRISLDAAERSSFTQFATDMDGSLRSETRALDRVLLPAAIELESYRDRFRAPVTFVRHAPTQFNVEKRIQGQVDMPVLFETLHHYLNQFRGLPQPDLIVTSPLERAYETAMALSTLRGWARIPIVAADGLKERAWGVFEGKSREEIREFFSEIDQVVDQPGFTPVGGESLDAVGERVTATLDRILELYPGRKLLVVTHRGSLLSIGTGPVDWAEGILARGAEGLIIVDLLPDIREQRKKAGS